MGEGHHNDPRGGRVERRHDLFGCRMRTRRGHAFDGRKSWKKRKVTGLDNDGKIGREALEVLRSLGSSNFEFIEGNVEHIEETIKEKYDVVHARFLLFHLKDPVSALRKMHELTKPGGSIIVQDMISGRRMNIHPVSPAKRCERSFSPFARG